MEFTAVACNLLTKKTDCLVITLGNQVTDNAPAKSSALEAIDNAISGLISRLLKSGDLKQEPNSSVLINEPQGLSADRLLILGTGSKPLNEQSFVALAKNIAAQLTKLPIKTACISLAGLEVDLREGQGQAQPLASQVAQTGYLVNPFQNKEKKPTTFKQVT